MPMKRSIAIDMAVIGVGLLTAAAVTGYLALASPKRPRLADTAVTVTPAEFSSPVTPEAPLQVCVSGFLDGNHVAVRIPWKGSPAVSSGISVNFNIGPSGGACEAVPRAAIGDIMLEPGVYEVICSFAPTNRDDTLPCSGTTLTVLP